MILEQAVNYQLNKYPKVKKVIKRCYQLAMYTVSRKIKSEGFITKLSPNDPQHEYFFGYYDKSPWDRTGRYVLCLRADNTWTDVSPKAEAQILVIDVQNGNDVSVIGSTRSWNVQQGCMLQWLGPDFSNRILYNDYRDSHYCSVIQTLDFTDGIKVIDEKVLNSPVYSVATDGSFALTLDFSRLHRLRPGYGYYNIPDFSANEKLPDSACIWYIDLKNGDIKSILKYKDFADFETRPEMKDAQHKVNHIMISPDGKRFMVLYRWFRGDRKYTRLVTCNVDGTDMYNLCDDDMVSHCCWIDNNRIFAFAHKKTDGNGYFLMKDRTPNYIRYWNSIDFDGHPSISPDGSKIVFDRYPDRARIAAIFCCDIDSTSNEDVKTLARVFAPFKYDNDTRCDLHPRWNRNSDCICFDSVFEGHRGLYAVPVDNGDKRMPEKDKKYKIVYVFTSCKRSGPIQVMYDVISKLDRNVFTPILVTLYEEIAGESFLDVFKVLGIEHHRIPLGKKDILLGRTGILKDYLRSINPDIIHSMGVFPDYAISRMKFNCQVITLHNHMHTDFYGKYGKIKGALLEYLHMYAVKHSAQVWTCSKSLADIYAYKDSMYFDYIRNGVDTKKYRRVSTECKHDFRARLGLPVDSFIFVYSGQMIYRKNQRFLLGAFSEMLKKKSAYLVLLGNGSDYEDLFFAYGNHPNIDFRGNVSNVKEFLFACDAYVSTSISEGMPMGVLEAMAAGLPVVLSDIPQHLEIFDIASEKYKIGYIYKQGDRDDLIANMINIINTDYHQMGKNAETVVEQFFSADEMSNNYQKKYESVISFNRK